MIVAVMQPYLFPYIGYFQLIAACDVFVLYDDAQYMKGGWINRNRILLGGQPHWFTAPVQRAPVETPINAMRYRLDADERRRLAELLRSAYRKAPGWEAARAVFDEVMRFPSDNVARFNEHAIGIAARALGLAPTILRTSELGRDTGLRGQDAVIDICRRLNARRYVNSIGGVGLYDPAAFARAGLELAFVQPQPPPYAQFGAEPVPNLSILDVLMFCGPEAVQAQLDACRLITPKPEGARP